MPLVQDHDPGDSQQAGSKKELNQHRKKDCAHRLANEIDLGTNVNIGFHKPVGRCKPGDGQNRFAQDGLRDKDTGDEAHAECQDIGDRGLRIPAFQHIPDQVAQTQANQHEGK